MRLRGVVQPYRPPCLLVIYKLIVFAFWMIFLYDLGVRCQDWREIYMELILN